MRTYALIATAYGLGSLWMVYFCTVHASHSSERFASACLAYLWGMGCGSSLARCMYEATRRKS